MLFDAFKEDMSYKYGYDSSALTSDEELDDVEISNLENNESNICSFKGKTAGGLKTHIRRKHGHWQKAVWHLLWLIKMKRKKRNT